ncbi:MAG: precorrin-2 C(20)-methyltransferase [Spirochaeta sp. LUC14_002_19_P3]|nr:MAG: precorrin-2 C(20)-methyltransferase [Spirochaeta sp. LUC14_002_19_P3]
MTFYGIGTGPGDPELLTLKAARILRSVQRIFYVAGPSTRESLSRVIASAAGKEAEGKLRKLEFSMAHDMADRRHSWQANAQAIAAELGAGENCAFATIGDPMLYSTFVYILPLVKELIPNLAVEVVPGITSFQAAAAAGAFPLAMNDEILSIIPAWHSDTLERPAAADADTAVFLKTYRSRDAAVDFSARHYKGDFLYAVKVGRPEERFCTNRALLKDLPEEYLSLIISKKRKANDGLD